MLRSRRLIYFLSNEYSCFSPLYTVYPKTRDAMPYIPRNQNVIQHVFKDHFKAFEETYEESYSQQYGLFRLDRIHQAANRFANCGDYLKGIARIKCTNSDCNHEYFRPFSCKQWYLCPSCHQKRTLLLSEHLCEHVLFRLPHRQFVFTIPKALRIYFRHDRNLFSHVSKIIHRIVTDYYTEVKGFPVTTGIVVSHQTAGDLLRWNAHWHCIILEGGIDEQDNFHYIPVKSLDGMVELFRHLVIELLVTKNLLNESFAQNLLTWKNSGFSIDNSVWILSHDDKARKGLTQYITRHPVALKKITYEPTKGKMLYKTKVAPGHPVLRDTCPSIIC
jgi:hypothetical protein